MSNNGKSLYLLLFSSGWQNSAKSSNCDSDRPSVYDLYQLEQAGPDQLHAATPDESVHGEHTTTRHAALP